MSAGVDVYGGRLPERVRLVLCKAGASTSGVVVRSRKFPAGARSLKRIVVCFPSKFRTSAYFGFNSISSIALTNWSCLVKQSHGVQASMGGSYLLSFVMKTRRTFHLAYHFSLYIIVLIAYKTTDFPLTDRNLTICGRQLYCLPYHDFVSFTLSVALVIIRRHST